MKKVFLMAIAAVAIMFASCGNKSQGGDTKDSLAADTAAVVDANAAAEESINSISALFGGKDANALKEAIEAVKAKAAELLAQNPEVAKEYLTKVQTFLKENTDKIKSVVGDNAAVSAAVHALTTTSADDVISGLSSALSSAKATGAEAVEGAAATADKAVEAVKNAPEAAKEAADKAKEKAKEKINEKANEAVSNAKQKAAESVDKVGNDVKKSLGL